jgi:Smg protein
VNDLSKEKNILGIVAFLFENFSQNKIPVTADFGYITNVLEQAGFSPENINDAFNWLGVLLQQISTQHSEAPRESIRLFTPEESVKIGIECQNFILSLEQAGILNARTREIVINQLMQLEQDMIEVADVRWVILTVLLGHADQKSLNQLQSFIAATKERKDVS